MKKHHLKPDYAKAYNNLGIALQELGEHKKQQFIMKKQFKANPIIQMPTTILEEYCKN